MTIKWECELCVKSGIAKTTKHTDVMSGIYAVMDSHKEVSPNCEAGMFNIRVIVEMDINQDEPNHPEFLRRRVDE